MVTIIRFFKGWETQNNRASAIWCAISGRIPVSVSVSACKAADVMEKVQKRPVSLRAFWYCASPANHMSNYMDISKTAWLTDYMEATIASPNCEQLRSVAPSIRRSKS